MLRLSLVIITKCFFKIKYSITIDKLNNTKSYYFVKAPPGFKLHNKMLGWYVGFLIWNRNEWKKWSSMVHMT